MANGPEQEALTSHCTKELGRAPFSITSAQTTVTLSKVTRAKDVGRPLSSVTGCGGKGVDLGSKLSSASHLISQSLGLPHL